jgi:hypothetical protein
MAGAGGRHALPDVSRCRSGATRAEIAGRFAHIGPLIASDGVETLKNLHWPLVLGLGALALVRPLIRIVTDPSGTSDAPATAITLTLVISVIWVAAVGLTRVSHPVLTLVCAGVVYGVLSIVLSGILSPILTGQLQGPLAMPFAIIPVLAVNAVWGLITGVIALLVRRARSGSAR